MRYCVARARLLVDLEHFPRGFRMHRSGKYTSWNQSEFDALPDVPSPVDVVAFDVFC
jgi:hypothetical protein